MNLYEWIKNNDYDTRSFAEKYGLNVRNIQMWARGERMPRLQDAKKIIDATNDEVNGKDFYIAGLNYYERKKGKLKWVLKH